MSFCSFPNIDYIQSLLCRLPRNWKGMIRRSWEAGYIGTPVYARILIAREWDAYGARQGMRPSLSRTGSDLLGALKGLSNRMKSKLEHSEVRKPWGRHPDLEGIDALQRLLSCLQAFGGRVASWPEGGCFTWNRTEASSLPAPFSGNGRNASIWSPGSPWKMDGKRHILVLRANPATCAEGLAALGRSSVSGRRPPGIGHRDSLLP